MEKAPVHIIAARQVVKVLEEALVHIKNGPLSDSKIGGHSGLKWTVSPNDINIRRGPGLQWSVPPSDRIIGGGPGFSKILYSLLTFK